MKSSEFRAITEAPLNGAPDSATLVRSPLTSVADFFVRNHGAPAQASPNWQIVVTGMVRNPFTLAISEIAKAGARAEIEATLQCAGNRRTALQLIRQIPNEIPWDNAAIGNALWQGIPLRDVLERAGVLDGATHVWFRGGETVDGAHAAEGFGASIPLAKALDRSTLIADSMNGAPLTAQHGAPVRVIVPGYIGARSVKWLAEIRVESGPTPNHYQRGYSVYPPSVLSVPADHTGGRVLDEFPVSSAFGSPADGEAIAAGRVTLRGWSVVGGDRTIERVEVSTDGGATWGNARFQTAAKPFVWRLWDLQVDLPRGEHELVCRAVDSAGTAQPDDPRETWNIKGYVNNCWDRVVVRAD